MRVLAGAGGSASGRWSVSHLRAVEDAVKGLAREAVEVGGRDGARVAEARRHKGGDGDADGWVRRVGVVMGEARVVHVLPRREEKEVEEQVRPSCQL